MQATTTTEQAPSLNNLPSELSGTAYRPTPLTRLIELRKKGLTYKEIGAITGDKEDAIAQRFCRAGIDSEELLDYQDAKAEIHEALQWKISKAVSSEDIQKAPLGTKVLAICQLEDKIRLIRGQSTGNISLHVSILDQAEQLERSSRASQTQDVVVEPDNGK